MKHLLYLFFLLASVSLSANITFQEHRDDLIKAKLFLEKHNILALTKDVQKTQEVILKRDTIISECYRNTIENNPELSDEEKKVCQEIIDLFDSIKNIYEKQIKDMETKTN